MCAQPTHADIWAPSQKARAACFTYFFNTEELEEGEIAFSTDSFNDPKGYVKYAIAQRECCPSTGRLHLQGYAEFRTTLTRGQVLSLLPGAHWSVRRGKAEQCIAYCKKSETRDQVRETKGGPEGPGPWEFGTQSRQGHRSDLDVLAGLVRDGMPDHEIAQVAPGALLRYARNIDRLREACRPPPPIERPMRVTIIWGAPGTGKTHAAFEIDPELFRVPSDDGKWFDGYQGQKTILIDDFQGDWPAIRLRTICDKWQMNVAIKGAFATARWEHVVITSNTHPRTWYPLERPEHRAALMRRITRIIHPTKQYVRDGYESLPDEMAERPFGPTDTTVISTVEKREDNLEVNDLDAVSDLLGEVI